MFMVRDTEIPISEILIGTTPVLTMVSDSAIYKNLEGCETSIFFAIFCIFEMFFKVKKKL